MGWIAAVLGIFLFYKFVDSKDKVKLYKLVGGFIVIASVGAGVYWVIAKSTEKKQEELVTVEFSGHRFPKNSKVLERAVLLAKVVILQYAKEVEPTAKQIDPEDLAVANREIASRYFNGDLLPKTRYDDDWDKSWNLSMDGFSNDAKKKEADEFDRALRERYLAEIDARIKASQSAFFTHMRINAMALAFTGKLEEGFYKVLSSKPFPYSIEKQSLNDQVDRVRDRINVELNNIVSEKNPTEFSISICNKRKDADLEKVEIRLGGRESSRSTYRDPSTGSEGEDRLNSDIIIKRDSCNTITWTGSYRFYSAYRLNPTDYNVVWSSK